MDEELRSEIISIIERNVCEVGAEGLESGEILGADTAADEIMRLVEREMEEDRRSMIIDLETRQQ